MTEIPSFARRHLAKLRLCDASASLANEAPVLNYAQASTMTERGMRNLRTVLGAGITALAAIGFCGIAAAQSPQTHLMTVTLPDGGAAQIRYTGPVAPRISFSDTPAPVFAAMPAFFGAGSPFAELERISTAMDRQADRMLRAAATLAAGGGHLDLTAVGAMPAGSREYSFVSAMNGGNVCSRSMVITSQGNGAPPKVVTHTSGNCGAVSAPGIQLPTQLPAAPAPANGPRMIMTKAVGSRHLAARVEEAALN